MTFSNWAAIESTLVQLSAISVPPLSAAYPPNEGMTSPPELRIAVMSEPKVPAEIGIEVSPLKYTVHEPRLAVCTKARVRNLLPDCVDSPDRLSPLYASKYGANTWAGMRDVAAAWAWGLATASRPATQPATVAA